MSVLINVVSAGIVPEYSVVRYYVAHDSDSPYVGYLLQGSNDNMMLVDPAGMHFIHLGADDLVELLATPAATACFYIGNKKE